MALITYYWIKNMMKKTFLMISISVFGLMTLSGCALILLGGAAETALVVGDRRPVSVQTIDRGLQLQIDSVLAQKFSENSHVNTTVYNQKVLLTGEAKTQELKDQIQKTIAPITNIRTLVNEIQIAQPSSTGSRISDSTLFTVVKTRLLSTTDVPNNSMKVVVENGRVYLLGLVTELEAKAAATVVSKSSDSVKEVVKLFDIISDEQKQKLINGSEKTQ
jgi:osmotically-inducible protein OsmY